MHKLIGVIVYALNEEDAIDNASAILGKIVRRGDYDYYILLGDEYTTRRWGDLKPVYRADSEDGKKLINDLMDKTFNEFKEKLNIVRKILKTFSDEEIFEQQTNIIKCIALNKAQIKEWKTLLHHLSLIKHYFYCLCDYSCLNTYLIDNDGEPIHNFNHLKKVLEKWRRSNGYTPYEDMNVYIVPADVHY